MEVDVGPAITNPTTLHITTERRQHLNKAEVEPGITFLNSTENV